MSRKPYHTRVKEDPLEVPDPGKKDGGQGAPFFVYSGHLPMLYQAV